MEEKSFLPKAKMYKFKGLELVFMYKHCNKTSVNIVERTVWEH